MGKKKMFMKNTIGGVIPPVVTIPLENIISEYKFEDNVLDTVSNNDGTATDITYASGLVGKTGVFNGSTSKVVIADNDNLSFVNVPFSVSCLVSFDNTGDGWIVNKRDNVSTGSEWQLFYYQNKVSFWLLSPNGVDRIMLDYSFAPTLNQVYHLQCTYDGGSLDSGLKIYIDGTQVIGTNSSAGTFTGMTNTTSVVIIGTNGWDESFDFTGDIDCLRIWNKELTQEEANLIATDELAGIDINP